MTTQSPLTNGTPLLINIRREPITIRDVKITRLTYQPADGSYVHECGPVVLTKYDVAIVELFTDQGLVGIGPGNVNDSNDYRHLIGQNPFDLIATGYRRGWMWPVGISSARRRASRSINCWRPTTNPIRV